MAREITSLTGLPGTVSMAECRAVKHSCVSVVVRAFRACVNIERNFFLPPSGKLVAAKKGCSVQKEFR